MNLWLHSNASAAKPKRERGLYDILWLLSITLSDDCKHYDRLFFSLRHKRMDVKCGVNEHK